MNYYEIMLIVRPDVESEEQQAVLEDLKSAIAKESGTLSTILDWRKRRLSYEIKKHKEGQYYLVYFSGEGNIIPEIEHYFRVTDEVLRYMIVSISEDDYNSAAEKAAAEAKAAEAAVEEAAAAEVEGSQDAAEAVEIAEESSQESEVAEEIAPEEPQEEEAVAEAETDPAEADDKEKTTGE